MTELIAKHKTQTLHFHCIRHSESSINNPSMRKTEYAGSRAKRKKKQTEGGQGPTNSERGGLTKWLGPGSWRPERDCVGKFVPGPSTVRPLHSLHEKESHGKKKRKKKRERK